MSKSLGQIAFEAASEFLSAEYLEDGPSWDGQLPGVRGLWNAAANAVAEECAKIADSEVEASKARDNQNADFRVYAAMDMAMTIRALKAMPT